MNNDDGEIPLSALRSGHSGWIWFVVVVVLIGGVGWLWIDRQNGSSEPAVLSFVDAGPQTEADTSGDQAQADMPPPSPRGDGPLTTSPVVEKWLKAQNLSSRLTAAMSLVAAGDSPRPLMTFLEIKGSFAVQRGASRTTEDGESRDRLFIAPRSYSRYDVVAQTLRDIDPAVLGQMYRQLRPEMTSAFAAISRPGAKFDDALVKALQRLVSVQIPEGPIEVVPKGMVYAFADPSLESLGDAEKHLLRMGPKNAHLVQEALRRFAQAANLSLKP